MSGQETSGKELSIYHNRMGTIGTASDQPRTIIGLWSVNPMVQVRIIDIYG
jgi:hypothetical protein